MTASRPGADLDELARSFVDPAQDRATKRGYLPWFARCARVLDLGCGHGAFLDVARDAGIEAHGIDRSPAAVAVCAAHGHRVEAAELGDALRAARAAGTRYDGALLAHVVEHLLPVAAAELFTAIAAVLVPGARLVVVTPNVRNLIVLEETFWLDPTHVRPYPRPLLAKLGDAAGFGVVASFDDPHSRPQRRGLRRLLAWLRSRWAGADRSAPMDAIVVLVRR